MAATVISAVGALIVYPTVIWKVADFVVAARQAVVVLPGRVLNQQWLCECVTPAFVVPSSILLHAVAAPVAPAANYLNIGQIYLM